MHLTDKVIALFRSRIHYGKPNDCWEWGEGYFGYRKFQFDGKPHGAHRVMWTIKNGPIPNGKMICHTCDNPPCVNPAHLFLGNNSSNMQDAVDKKRHNQTRKTHCPQGHPYSKTNTKIRYVTAKGYRNRRCKECHRTRERNRRRAVRLAQRIQSSLPIPSPELPSAQ